MKGCEHMLLTLNHVTKKYPQFKLDCSLELQPGRITGLIGSNGAGKSTTFKSILGLITPDSGELRIFDKEWKNFTEQDKALLGSVLPDADPCRLLTPADCIPVMKGFYPDFEEERYLTLCGQYGLPMKKAFSDFSTGMKVKLKVILALTHHARLLILDEPTSGLDVVMRREVLDMLRDFMENEENGILISSHISSDLENLCDDIYLMQNGQIILHEDTDILLSGYGILKLSEKQFREIDRSHILAMQKESYGYLCLTKQKDFYMDNYPDHVIEKCSIDEIMMILAKGEPVK